MRTINRCLHYNSANSASMLAAQRLYGADLMYMWSRTGPGGGEWQNEVGKWATQEDKYWTDTEDSEKREEIQIHHRREKLEGKTQRTFKTCPHHGSMTRDIVALFPNMYALQNSHDFITFTPWIWVFALGVLPLLREEGEQWAVSRLRSQIRQRTQPVKVCPRREEKARPDFKIINCLYLVKCQVRGQQQKINEYQKVKCRESSGREKVSSKVGK